jgi:hypothetical protein
MDVQLNFCFSCHPGDRGGRFKVQPRPIFLGLTRTAAWFRRQNLERSFGLKDLKKIVNFLKDRCAPSHVSRTSTPVLLIFFAGEQV